MLGKGNKYTASSAFHQGLLGGPEKAKNPFQLKWV